jgi:TPR repeat protein
MSRALGGYRLGRAYATGDGAIEDAERAQHYYTKACDGGIELACKRIGKSMPEAARRILARRRVRGLFELGAIAVVLIVGLPALGVAAYRRMTSGAP